MPAGVGVQMWRPMGSRRRIDYEPSRNLLVDEVRTLCLELGSKSQALPSETELATRFGVGRATLRDALTRLESEGLILRRKGADTIVNAAALDLSARIDLQVDFAEILSDAGFKSEVTLLDSGRRRLGSKEASSLGLERGTPALRTVKRWDADGRPVMLAIDWIPLFQTEEELDPTTTVFDLAAVASGEEITWEVACPGAVAITGDTAKWMKLKSGIPVWTLERVGMGQTGRRCFLAMEYHLPSVVRYGFVRSVRRP